MSTQGVVPSLGMDVDSMWRVDDKGLDDARFKQAILARRRRYADLLASGTRDHADEARSDASQAGAS